MTQAELHYQKMTRTPVEKLIASLAIPTIISMLITNIYNLADTYFVGTLGVSASGAVGVVFTLMSVLQALGFMFGHGAGSNISRRLAEKDVEAASHYLSTSFFLSVATGLAFTLLGILFIRPFMRLLGSTETILPYAMDYAIYILLAAPAMVGSLVLNNVLRYEGKAFYAMIGLTLGGILNMIGDPIFIYGCHMGIHGAGLSTALSQYISFAVLICLTRRHAQSQLKLRNFSKQSGLIRSIVTTGCPNLFRQGLTSVSSGILNHCAGLYGDPCVSAMSIVSRCQFFMLSIALGIGQGFQPVAGFNYQAKKYRRLRRAFRFTLLSGIAVLVVLCGLGFLFAPQIVRLFQSDPQVLEIGSLALRLASLSLIITPVNITPTMMFQSSGLNARATLLACLRGGFCFIPIVLVLPRFMGLPGIQLAQPLADVLTSLLSVPFFITFFRSIPKEDEYNENDLAADAA